MNLDSRADPPTKTRSTPTTRPPTTSRPRSTSTTASVTTTRDVDVLRQDRRRHLGRVRRQRRRRDDQRESGRRQPGRCRVVSARDAWTAATKAVPPVQADIDKAAAAYAAAAGRRRRRRHRRRRQRRDHGAIKAAASSAGSTPATRRTRSTRTSPRAVSVPGVPVGHPELRLQRRAVAALMAPQTLPLTSTLPVYPPTGSKDTLSSS
jgi:hypothetical protein